MSETIWKYPVPPVTQFDLELPAGAVPLTVQVQNDKPAMWAQVDPDAAVEPYTFEVLGTGAVFDEAFRIYVGTFQLEGGALVFHLFQRIDP